MDRGKSTSSRGAKSKITQHPPDIFALGSKPSSRDGDTKRAQGKSTASHQSSSKDRKREHSSSSISTAKKSKVASTTVIRPTSTASIAIPSDRPGTSSQTQSNVEFWETLAIESEPHELVPSVVKAFENGENDKMVAYVLGAIKNLKFHRYKPDKVLYLALIYLAKLRPSLFLNEHVINALASLLRKDSTHNFKSKGNPTVPALCANLLLRGHLNSPHWPELFVKLYVDDALSDRVWVDLEECKGFVDNVITAFNTRIPPKSLLNPELSSTLAQTRDTASPVTVTAVDDEALKLEGRNTPEIQLSSALDSKDINIPVISRYTQNCEQIEQIVLEAIKEQLNRRQSPENITRNFLRLLSSACGLVEVRIIAVSRIEVWLQNPKLMRPAQELLAYLCCNCNSLTQRDLEVTAHLTKIRLKTKALVNVYLNCLRELITLHPENLPSMLKYTIYNELSNSRNPNNMPMIAVMFQAAPEISANILAEIFQDLLMNKDDYLRSLRALLREIVRVLRFDINLFVLCRSLVQERKDLTQNIRDSEYRDRIFMSIGDLICLCILLGITPQVREAAQLLSRGDKKEISILQNYQNLVAKIQSEAVTWLHEHVVRIFRPTPHDFMHVLHKIFFLESSEQYYKIDMWPSESDRNFFLRLASEIPILQETLIRLLLIGLSKELILSPPDIIELVDSLIKRAAVLPTENPLALHIDRLDVIDFLFNLTVYKYPENISLPSGYNPPQLAISNLYWKVWILLLIISAHNPATFGNVAWKKYPMLRTFMEMCITNHFSYPPPTVAMAELFDELKNKELQICALEKQQILELESHLAAATTKNAITEQNSLLLSQVIEMKPTGESRNPPQIVLEQLHNLNNTHRMGHLLCRSRHPDFLLDIIQRQGASQHMPWLADLVHNSEGALSHLPVQCLCEYLLISGMQQTSEKNEKHKKHGQVLAHLQNVLTDSNQEVNAACEILEYFLRRLNSLHCASRIQAVKGLELVLSKVTVLDENIDDDILDKDLSSEMTDCWLLKQIPALPHFPAVRSLLVNSLRQACQVETDPQHISSYINFLGLQTQNDNLSDMQDLVIDMSQLIVERSTIIAAVLPNMDNDSRTAYNTLHSLMVIFCTYLSKLKEPRQDTYAWSESQDQVLISWANSEGCTMHILVVHAMIILLTFGPGNDQDLFDMLLDTWFPLNSEPPKAFLVDTSEEALLIPDWLKLRMIRSTVPRLVDAALVNLEPPQLVLFIQSFGIPVSSMSKLLCMLDSAVTIDQNSVDEAVLDKCYMAQLVEVQHRRGATGGSIFVQVLQLQEPKLPDEIIIETGRTRQEFPGCSMEVDNVTEDKHSYNNLINKLISVEALDANDKKQFGLLLKEVSREIHKKNCPAIISKNILSTIISKVDKANFEECILKNESYICTLVRLLLSKKHIYDDLLNLAINVLSKLSNKKNPFAVILRNFIQKETPEKKSENKKEFKNESPIEILQNCDLVSLEKTTKALVESSLQDTNNNNKLVEAMAKLLLQDSENQTSERNGLLIDWFAELEMEIISSKPEIEMELLFSTNPNALERFENKNWMCFRPYLLTLLTHRASWATLASCVSKLLQKFVPNYDPAAVLEFLWALTCNPKLWQGRDKFTPKNYRPENVLELTSEEILILIDYVCEEAYQFSQTDLFDATVSIRKIENRLPLLLQCLEGRKEYLIIIVKHLIHQVHEHEKVQEAEPQVINLDESPMDHEVLVKKTKSQIYEELLVLLYMKIPKITYYLSNSENKKLNMSKITEISTSVVDEIAHSLFTMLASTPRSKDWMKKSQEFEMLARKMASVHPALVLRQLPMIAGNLKGRTHLDFAVFKSRNHLNLFVQILGIVELLQPLIFEDEYSFGLEGILKSYFSLFKFHGHVKELQSTLGKFVSFLQSFLSHDAKRALKYLQQHAHLLNYLHMTYSNLRPLRLLMSSISLPKEHGNSMDDSSDTGEVLVAVARLPSPEPLPANWKVLTQGLTTLQDEDLSNILQEVEHVSNRRPSILETIIYQIAELILSPYSNVRQTSHVLLLRYLKCNPKSVEKSSPILSVILKCLNSENAEIVNNILDKLPEYVVYLQEHAVQILETAFVLGIKTNINTAASINRSISALNIQNGC